MAPYLASYNGGLDANYWKVYSALTVNNRNENALGEPVKIAISGPIISFLVPYSRQIMVFLLALLVTAGITLSIGQGLRLVIDQGFAGESIEGLNIAIAFIIVGILIVLALEWYGQKTRKTSV